MNIPLILNYKLTDIRMLHVRTMNLLILGCCKDHELTDVRMLHVRTMNLLILGCCKDRQIFSSFSSFCESAGFTLGYKKHAKPMNQYMDIITYGAIQ